MHEIASFTHTSRLSGPLGARFAAKMCMYYVLLCICSMSGFHLLCKLETGKRYRHPRSWATRTSGSHTQNLHAVPRLQSHPPSRPFALKTYAHRGFHWSTIAIAGGCGRLSSRRVNVTHPFIVSPTQGAIKISSSCSTEIAVYRLTKISSSARSPFLNAN